MFYSKITTLYFIYFLLSGDLFEAGFKSLAVQHERLENNVDEVWVENLLKIWEWSLS